MQRDIHAVLFDLDGTLIDTYDMILASFRHATRTVLGKVVPDETLMRKVGQPLAVQMWDFADGQAMHDELMGVYREHNERVHDELIRVFPGTAPALDRLKEMGAPLGVVTSKRHEAAVRALDCFDLAGYFEFVLGPDDWPEHKPDPGPVLHGCDLLGRAPWECLYVGDSPFDMQAGNGAGCPTAAALWGMFPRATLVAEHPTFLCADIGEVPALIDAGR